MYFLQANNRKISYIIQTALIQKYHFLIFMNKNRNKTKSLLCKIFITLYSHWCSEVSGKKCQLKSQLLVAIDFDLH